MKDFTNRVKEKGYKVVHVFPVLYQGWECDEWAAVVEKNGSVKLAQTNHGSLYFVEGEEANHAIKELINRYQ